MCVYFCACLLGCHKLKMAFGAYEHTQTYVFAYTTRSPLYTNSVGKGAFDLLCQSALFVDERRFHQDRTFILQLNSVLFIVLQYSEYNTNPNITPNSKNYDSGSASQT